MCVTYFLHPRNINKFKLFEHHKKEVIKEESLSSLWERQEENPSDIQEHIKAKAGNH